MYYRVAIQVDAQPAWKWKSPALSSLGTLFHWFQYYRALPQDRLRVFSSSSEEKLNEQLVRENQGLGSPSVPAIQFLQERRMPSQGATREAPAGGTQADERTASLALRSSPSPYESSTSLLEKRREELERGSGGDHDLPYSFALPLSMPQVLAWMRLLARTQREEWQAEVVFVSNNIGTAFF